MSYQPDDDTLLFRFAGEAGNLPIIPVHLDVVGSTQIVVSVPRPDLPVSVISTQWARALELSEGAGVMAQIATDLDDSARLWGPCELITPRVDETLDPATGGPTVGGFFLGQDLLGTVNVTFLGRARLVVVMRSVTE